MSSCQASLGFCPHGSLVGLPWLNFPDTVLDLPALLSCSCLARLPWLGFSQCCPVGLLNLAVPISVLLDFPGFAVLTTILLSIGPAWEAQICLSTAETRDLEKNQHGAWTEDPEHCGNCRL